MIWDYFKTCCQMTQDSLDGAFGWYWDIATIGLIIVLFNFGFKRVLSHLQQRFQQHNQIGKESFVKALYEPSRCFIWYFAALELIDFLSVQLLGKSHLPEKQMMLAIGFVVSLTWFLMRWKSNLVVLIARRTAKQTQPVGDAKSDATRIDMVDKVVTVVIFFIAAGMLLEVTGSNLNTLIAFGGISGLAIAFASQEIIASFFGGLMIYITHPFMIGDWILIPERNIEGHVEEIGWYTTKIRTFEKCPIYVPNSIFSKIVVVNPSRMSHRRIKETIGIRYSDVHVLKEIIGDLKEMLRSDVHIDDKLPIVAYFVGFGASSLDIQLSAYTKEITSEGFNKIKENVLFNVIDILVKHHAEVAFPTTCLEISQPLPLMANSAATH